MSAAEALKQARATGIRVEIDGDALLLEALAQPSAALLDLLAHHKRAILAQLRQGNDGWSGEDWREFFEERAGIAEFDGGLPRDQAQALAFSCCVAEWLHRNPTRSASRRCAHCGVSEGLLLPYLTDYSVNDPGHTWLHPGCSQTWHQARRSEAVSALELMGICVSGKLPDDFRSRSRK